MMASGHRMEGHASLLRAYADPALNHFGDAPIEMTWLPQQAFNPSQAAASSFSDLWHDNPS
jgi:hypothetical protein